MPDPVTDGQADGCTDQKQCPPVIRFEGINGRVLLIWETEDQWQDELDPKLSDP